MADPSLNATALRLLSRGPFARYIAGETISMIGTWMQLFAQGYLLTTLTSEASVLGAVNFAAGLPMLLLTAVGGTFADRYDKRLILVIVLSTQLALAVLVGWLVATGQIAIWHIFAVSVLLGIAGAFEVPTISALVPELVSRDDLASAIAIDRSIFHATRLIGPAMGGYLVGALGTASAYYVNAATFVALLGAILSIAPRATGSAEEEAQRRGSFREGLDYVRGDAPTFAMILLMAALTVFISPFLMILMPLYARTVLGLEADRMGLLMAISGVGSLTGSIGLLSIPHGRRALALKIAAGAIALALAGLGLAPSFGWGCAALILMTLGGATSFGMAHTIIQERAPGAMRGRVSAVAGLSFFGILPFSGLLMSALADALGLRMALMVSAACFGGVAALLLGRRRQLASAPVPVEEP